MKFPPNWQFKKILRQSCTLKKLEKEEIEDEYGQAVESWKEYTVTNIEIQPVTAEDLVLLPAGTLKIGDARAWFKEYLSGTLSLADFNDSSLYSFNSTKILVENGEAKLKSPYSTDNPTIEKTSGDSFMAPPIECDFEEYKPSGTEIRYILSPDNGTTWYYHDGYNWVTSDGTFDKAVSSSTISSKLSDLPFNSGTFKFKAFLHSDGSSTPVLRKFSMKFGVKLEADDRIIDHQGIEYRVDTITDYYSKEKVILKEVYLRRTVGE